MIPRCGHFRGNESRAAHTASGFSTSQVVAWGTAGALHAAGILITPAAGAMLMSISTALVAINARLLRLNHSVREAPPRLSRCEGGAKDVVQPYGHRGVCAHGVTQRRERQLAEHVVVYDDRDLARRRTQHREARS